MGLYSDIATSFGFLGDVLLVLPSVLAAIFVYYLLNNSKIIKNKYWKLFFATGTYLGVYLITPAIYTTLLVLSVVAIIGLIIKKKVFG